MNRIYRRIIAADKVAENNFIETQRSIAVLVGQMAEQYGDLVRRIDSLAPIVAHTQRLLKEKETLQRKVDLLQAKDYEPPATYTIDGKPATELEAMRVANTYMGDSGGGHSHGLRGTPALTPKIYECPACGRHAGEYHSAMCINDFASNGLVRPPPAKS